MSEIKKTFTDLKDFGVHAYSRLKTSVTEKRLKKEEVRRQMILMSGCIRRVK